MQARAACLTAAWRAAVTSGHHHSTWDAVLCEGRLLLDEERQAGVLVVVRDHLDQLGEVPGIPLAHAHHKGVDVLVQRVQQGDSLDDHVVHPVHVKLHLRSAGPC